MEQKIVIKISTPDRKSRSKAMETAVGSSGVTSVALAKDDQMEVKGIGVDAIELINNLRKRFATTTCCLKKRKGYASLVSVEEIKKKISTESTTEEKPNPTVCGQRGCCFPCQCRGPMFICVEEYPYPSSYCFNNSGCALM